MGNQPIRKTKKTGVVLLTSLISLLILAVTSALLLSRNDSGPSGKGSERGGEQAYLSVSSAAELLKDLILVSVDGEGKTERYIRAVKNEQGIYTTLPRKDPEDPLGRGVFPEPLEGILCQVLETGLNPHSHPFQERTLTINTESRRGDRDEEASSAASALGTVYARFYTLEGDDPYSFFAELYQGQKDQPAYRLTIHFKGSDMGIYSDEQDTRDVYWYEAMVTR